ncbi:MAG TPA: hypothetical protein VMB47_14275 [Candidatus Aquilonibacter sp.]|nr:hypothetical protein [Candidatus Aquilonibacter sp.]
MKRFVLGIAGAVCLWAATAAAQTNVGNTQLLATPSAQLGEAPASSQGYAPNVTLLSGNEPSDRPADTLGLSMPAPAPAPAAAPSASQSVFQTFPMEVYFGYMFYRFYELPAATPNLNGFNFSVQYYLNDWFGLDGEFAAGFNSGSTGTGHACFGGGGPRVRWSAGNGIEVWGHGMVGGSCINTETQYGDGEALAYQVGGGIDINAHHHRFAYRVAADMVGTTFFNTHQYSPKISAGIVFKF